MAIEIVDFPINSMVMFHSYVKLPEGNLHITKFGVFKVLTTKHPTDVDAVSNRIAPLSFSVYTHTYIYIIYNVVPPSYKLVYKPINYRYIYYRYKPT